MATQIVMPKLSPTMEEGQLTRWLKREGDKVSMGEPLAEVDTDKATMEAPALTSGVLRKILVQEGETVALGNPIAIIGEADEDISAMLGAASANSGNGAGGTPQAAAKPEGDSPQATTEPRKQIKQEETVAAAGSYGTPPASPPQAATSAPPNQPATQDSDRQTQARLIVSPLAARMAAEAGINLQNVSGSGPGGRIVKRDVETAISAATRQPATTQQTPQTEPQPASQTQPQPQVAQQPQAAPAQQSQVQGAASFRDQPNTEMRRTIARRLTSSIGPIPHFFLTSEIEMDAAADLRKQLNLIDAELKISFNDIIIKVAAVALIQHPQVNASFQDQTTRYYDAADIGVAVALEDGLITPVIRAANTKSIGAISREVRELAERARARRLKPEEYTGATFSVSNLGMFGIDDFTAVINPPEAAIIAVGTVTAKPVVRDGEIVVRQMMRVTMSCDHRVVDGATGAKFLQTFKQILETPLRLLTA